MTVLWIVLWWLASASGAMGLAFGGWWASYRLRWVAPRPTWSGFAGMCALCLPLSWLVKDERPYAVAVLAMVVTAGVVAILQVMSRRQGR